ncbi:MAG: hypothetical protein ABIA66_00075 [Candidatus Omnitrophota bacterium]
MSRYQKIHSQLWQDEKIKILSDSAKLLFLYILSSPHSNSIGLYVLPKGYVFEDLKWSEKQFGKPFRELLGKQLIYYDFESNLIMIKNHLKHNPLENENQTKAALKIFSALPKSQIISHIKEQLTKPFHKLLLEQLPKLLPEQYAKPEEKEKEKECPNSNSFLNNEKPYKLSCYLLQLLLDRKPDLKRPDLQKWANSFDLMIRIDHRDPDRIAQVIEWSQKDPFWKNNILSPDKLRKQFDNLELKMEAK